METAIWTEKFRPKTFDEVKGQEEIVKRARSQLPEITGQELRIEIQNLITANVIDYRKDGDLDFTFPAMRELARPLGNAKEAMTEMRRMARQTWRSLHPEQPA